MIKNLPAMQETRVRSLGWEDPLEKERAIHSSILAWKMLWTEELGWLQTMGFASPICKTVEHDLAAKQQQCKMQIHDVHLQILIIGQGEDWGPNRFIIDLSMNEGSCFSVTKSCSVL